MIIKFEAVHLQPGLDHVKGVGRSRSDGRGNDPGWKRPPERRVCRPGTPPGAEIVEMDEEGEVDDAEGDVAQSSRPKAPVQAEDALRLQQLGDQGEGGDL